MAPGGSQGGSVAVGGPDETRGGGGAGQKGGEYDLENQFYKLVEKSCLEFINVSAY